MNNAEVVIVTGIIYSEKHQMKSGQPSIRLNQFKKLAGTFEFSGNNKIFDITLKSYDAIHFENKVELLFNNSECYIHCPNKGQYASAHNEFSHWLNSYGKHQWVIVILYGQNACVVKGYKELNQLKLFLSLP